MQLKCLRDVPVCFKDWPKDSILRIYRIPASSRICLNEADSNVSLISILVSQLLNDFSSLISFYKYALSRKMLLYLSIKSYFNVNYVFSIFIYAMKASHLFNRLYRSFIWLTSLFPRTMCFYMFY